MGLNIKSIVKCTLTGMGISAIILFILSLLEYFTAINEGLVSALAYGAVAAGSLIGGALLTISAGGKIIWHVLIMCGVYIAVLILLSALINGRIFLNAHSFAMTGGIIVSALLGMLAANKKN